MDEKLDMGWAAGRVGWAGAAAAGTVEPEEGAFMRSKKEGLLAPAGAGVGAAGAAAGGGGLAAAGAAVWKSSKSSEPVHELQSHFSVELSKRLPSRPAGAGAAGAAVGLGGWAAGGSSSSISKRLTSFLGGGAGLDAAAEKDGRVAPLEAPALELPPAVGSSQSPASYSSKLSLRVDDAGAPPPVR